MTHARQAVPCDPVDSQQWVAVALARGRDATAIQQQGTKCGAVYMAGYVLEAYLKAYWAACNWPYPKSGKEGHDLSQLWKKTNLSVDGEDIVKIHDFFLHQWSTDLRYCESCSFPVSADVMVQGAQQIGGLIKRAIGKIQSRSRYRKRYSRG